MRQKLALVSDFDGTISYRDFFDSVVEKYLDESALAPWRQYLLRQKTHFDALKEIFSKIHVKEEDLLSFIETLGIDKSFFNVCELCNQNDIPIYICSAGCDYYIRVMMGKEIDNYGIKLVTNFSFYSQSMGLVMQRPSRTESYYDYNVGIDKAAIAEGLKKQGYQVIYCGDGIPDFGAAKIADVVFARGVLQEMCNKEGIKTEGFEDFNKVYDYIKGNL